MLLRQDLVSFAHRVFATVNLGDRYVAGWHVEALCHQLARVRDGQCSRLIVNLPPRKMMGLESCGMLLSAVRMVNGKEELHLVMLDNSIPVGSAPRMPMCSPLPPRLRRNSIDAAEVVNWV